MRVSVEVNELLQTKKEKGILDILFPCLAQMCWHDSDVSLEIGG